MAFIIRSTIYQANQTDPYVDRHITVEAPDPRQALELGRRCFNDPNVSIVGVRVGGTTDYFMPWRP